MRSFDRKPVGESRYFRIRNVPETIRHSPHHSGLNTVLANLDCYVEKAGGISELGVGDVKRRVLRFVTTTPVAIIRILDGLEHICEVRFVRVILREVVVNRAEDQCIDLDKFAEAKTALH